MNKIKCICGKIYTDEDFEDALNLFRGSVFKTVKITETIKNNETIEFKVLYDLVPINSNLKWIGSFTHECGWIEIYECICAQKIKYYQNK